MPECHDRKVWIVAGRRTGVEHVGGDAHAARNGKKLAQPVREAGRVRDVHRPTEVLDRAGQVRPPRRGIEGQDVTDEPEDVRLSLARRDVALDPLGEQERPGAVALIEAAAWDLRAKAQGVTGYVVLNVLVGTDGTVEQVSVLEAQPAGWIEASPRPAFYRAGPFAAGFSGEGVLPRLTRGAGRGVGAPKKRRRNSCISSSIWPCSCGMLRTRSMVRMLTTAGPTWVCRTTGCPTG